MSATLKAGIGWCRNHEGTHNRRSDCTDWRYSVALVGCDASSGEGHGAKPHHQNEGCINPNTEKADPFYGF